MSRVSIVTVLNRRHASVFSDAWGWWRADASTGSSPTLQLTDLSGNGRHMLQQASTLTSGTANGQAKLTGTSTTWLSTSATLESWPVTIVAFGERTDATLQGHFGHVGASGFSTLWTGYESANRHMIYNNNSTNNTNSATNGVWVSRIGWGSRHAIINGVSQTDNTLASIVRSSAIAATLGTQYRGLNYGFQETLVWNRLLSLAELDEVYVYLNARYGTSIPLNSSYTAAPTILLVGESNAAGRGDRGVADANIPAEYLGAISNANAWHGNATANNATAGTAFETLDNTAVKTGFTGNHMFGDNITQPANYIGCESAMCKEYLDANGGSVWLNKYGTGGSFLAVQGSYWNHIDAGTQNNTSRLFSMNGFNWWRSIVAHHAAGRRPDLKAIIWIQGANDASNQTHADNYSANLAAFIPALRKEIGFPSARMIVARLHSGSPETYSSTVRAAQEAVVPGISNCELLDMDGYELRSGDPVHYSYNGQHQLGQDLAALLT